MHISKGVFKLIAIIIIPIPQCRVANISYLIICVYYNVMKIALGVNDTNDDTGACRMLVFSRNYV
jgi:hypothetical protein